MMKTTEIRLMATLLLISSCMGYMEWGATNSSFIIGAEIEVFRKLLNNPLDVSHPLILFPLAGQLLLLFSAFRKKPTEILIFCAIVMLSFLLLFIFIIGLLSLHMKMIFFNLPFIALSVWFVLRWRKQRRMAATA